MNRINLTDSAPTVLKSSVVASVSVGNATNEGAAEIITMLNIEVV